MLGVVMGMFFENDRMHIAIKPAIAPRAPAI